MAARLRVHHQEDVRRKIQSGELIRLLQLHVKGERDMSESQIRAAKVLLDKSVSNAAQEITGDVNHQVTVNILRLGDGK